MENENTGIPVAEISYKFPHHKRVGVRGGAFQLLLF